MKTAITGVDNLCLCVFVVGHTIIQNWDHLAAKQSASVEVIVSGKRLPETIAYVRITRQSWQQGCLEGDVTAGEFEWQFQWSFRRGELSVKPSQGRALIKEPLGRFLEQRDYQLEPGGDYAFTIRAEL